MASLQPATSIVLNFMMSAYSYTNQCPWFLLG